MPTPKALPLILSTRQQALLEHIASRTTNSYSLVTRAKLILGAARGVNNTALSQQLQLHRRRVRMWRQRWLEAGEQLATAEAEQVSDKRLRNMIEKILSDESRPGTPKFFKVEQVVQIVALACEDPKKIKTFSKSLDTKRVSTRSVGTRDCREDFSPQRRAFFKRRRLYNLIVIVTG